MSKIQQDQEKTQKRPENLLNSQNKQKVDRSFMQKLWSSNKSKLIILLFSCIVLVSLAFYFDMPIGFSVYTGKKVFSLGPIVYLLVLIAGLSICLYVLVSRHYKQKKGAE